MPDRRGAGRKIAVVLGCVALAAAAIVGVRYGVQRGWRGPGGAGASASAAIGASSSVHELAEATRNSDPRVLAEIERRLAVTPETPRKAFTPEEAEGWLEVLTGLRTGFLGYRNPGKIATVGIACRILDGFAVEPAAPQWADALPPLYDLLNASLGDSDPNLRATALDQVARLWVWLPARSITAAEEMALVKWKENIYRPVVRCLGHKDARTLIAAVACLGALPIDNAAAPALAYIDNPDPEVRKQTLVSFAKRNLLLTDDVLLTRLHDPDPMIKAAADAILRADRGLKQDQISMGALIFSPKPQQRISVIPLLKDRTDVDPVIWLIQLSRDPEEMVRLSAVEAMGTVKSNAIQRRLIEMARSDASEAVRKAAGKASPAVRESTAALPPLPGSPSLNPKAN